MTSYNHGTSRDRIYKYEIPKYEYEYDTPTHPSVPTEIYRYQLMEELVDFICSNLGQAAIDRHKLHVYISQLLMNTLTRKRPTNGFVSLDDPLFNRPTADDIAQFYRDLNSSYRKTLSNKFLPDEFKIADKINDIIEKLKVFKEYSINYEVYKDNKKQFIFKLENVDKGLENQLVLQQHIVDKCKKHYKGPTNKFYEILICCMIRYITLGSGANQYVVGLKYKKKLREMFGFNFECFGSVFNRYYDNFCSMFYDIEKYFGSCGSFFNLEIKSGLYMANPPYAEPLIISMYDHIKKSINNQNVTFIMMMPKWVDFALDKVIENDNLYKSKTIKHEHFHAADDQQRLILIPPYYEFIFSGVDVDKSLIDFTVNYVNEDVGRDNKSKLIIVKSNSLLI